MIKKYSRDGGEFEFRPHHFLCTLCFQGKGYSPAFIKNYKKIVAALSHADGDNIPIKVVREADVICRPCPHRREVGCATDEKIQRLDEAHAQALKLHDQQRLTWGEAKQRIKQSIDLPTFHKICASCEWKKFGICEQVVAAHQKSS